MTFAATIICPGPSLASVWIPRRDELRAHIAVNRAIDLGAEWYVAGDKETFERWPRRPRVGICAPEHVARRAAAGDYGDAVAAIFADIQVVSWETLRLVNDCVECNYSAVAACALAAFLGFRDADMYGADMAGIDDWDGTAQGSSRSPMRWAQEMADLRRIAAHFAQRGGTIVRHLSSGSRPIL